MKFYLNSCRNKKNRLKTLGYTVNFSHHCGDYGGKYIRVVITDDEDTNRTLSKLFRLNFDNPEESWTEVNKFLRAVRRSVIAFAR